MKPMRITTICLALAAAAPFLALDPERSLTGSLGMRTANAQQFQEPFRFRVRSNPVAANLAIIMKQIEDGSSTTTSSGNGSAPGVGVLNQYNSTTIGNLSEITTILEEGANGYVSAGADQNGSGSSQSSGIESTQMLGGNNAVGGNASSTVTNNGVTDGAGGGTGTQ